MVKKFKVYFNHESSIIVEIELKDEQWNRLTDEQKRDFIKQTIYSQCIHIEEILPSGMQIKIT